MHTEGLEFIRKQLGVYIRELKEEFSKGIILPTDKPKPQVITKGKTDVDKKSFQNEVGLLKSSILSCIVFRFSRVAMWPARRNQPVSLLLQSAYLRQAESVNQGRF